MVEDNLETELSTGAQCAVNRNDTGSIFISVSWLLTFSSLEYSGNREKRCQTNYTVTNTIYIFLLKKLLHVTKILLPSNMEVKPEFTHAYHASTSRQQRDHVIWQRLSFSKLKMQECNLNHILKFTNSLP